MKISDILSFSAPYEQSIKGNKIEETITLKLTHKPTQSNFWHVELTLREDYDEQKTKRVVKNLRNHLAAIIRPYSRGNLMEIPKNYYRH